MRLLETQELFETLWFAKPDDILDGVSTEGKVWIVYFTAKWCKACERLNLAAIEAAANLKKIPIWKCDDEVNNFTGGYCGVRQFPTFIAFQPGKIISRMSSSNTDSVIRWIQEINSA